MLGEHFTLPWCSSLRTTPAHQPPTQFSVVLVAAATGDLLDRVQHGMLISRATSPAMHHRKQEAP